MTDLDATVERLRERTDLPVEGEDLTFDAPWQARAFAVVVTLHDRGLFEWHEFQTRLIAAIQSADDCPGCGYSDDAGAAGESRYYRHWLAAAESLLREKGVLDDAELAARTGEFERGERDASEFVVGVEHAHAHTHDDDHDHSHGHAHSHDHGDDDHDQYGDGNDHE